MEWPYREYLSDEAKKKESLSTTVSGHNLGGALSATLALSLSDQQKVWDPNENANLSVFCIANSRL